MHMLAATEPGSRGQPNEDSFALAPDFAIVADGATARTHTGCVHGVAWFARRLAVAALSHAGEGPARALAFAIRETADAHRATCDLEDIATPGAAVGIAHIDEQSIHFLVLGDVSIVIEGESGIKILSDARVDQTATAERAAADALPSDSAEKPAALIAMKNAELASRNAEGGFWVAAADPEAVAHAITWRIPRTWVRRFAILTDGAARIVTPFELLDWEGALNLVESDGPAGLVATVREIERGDVQCRRWPRNKISDDATVIYIETGHDRPE